METLVHKPADPQQKLLKRYCAEAELLLKRATSADEARRLGDQMCTRLPQEGGSALVLHATRAYVADIINRMFAPDHEPHRSSDKH